MNTSRASKKMTMAAGMLLALSGTAAFAQYGGPQYGPPPGNGYSGYYHEDQGRPMLGARMGWQAGFAQGQSDLQRGHSYRPTHTDQFKHIPESPSGYPRDQFKHEFRDAFIRGYSVAYHGR